MIRILQFADVINRYDFIDGIVQRADRRRFEVGVCVRFDHSNIEAPQLPAGTARWRLPFESRRSFHRAAWRLARILRDWKCDILHVHHYDQALIGWLATRFHRRTRLVVGRHYSDAIYRSAAGWKRRALLAAEQIVNRAARRIIVPSAYIAEILSEWQGVRGDKIDLVPYGFVAEKYAAPRASEVERLRIDLGLSNRFVLANFARLHEEKGQRFLVEAAASLRARIPDLSVVIVGEGPERPNLERQIAAAGLADVVRLLGWRRDAMAIMAVADVVVQPTLQEAFSQVMAEALWMKKPLVITDVSGATDVISDGNNGLLVPKTDVDALVAAVSRLAQSSELRGALGREGRKYVSEHLRIEKVVPQYEEAYMKALQS